MKHQKLLAGTCSEAIPHLILLKRIFFIAVVLFGTASGQVIAADHTAGTVVAWGRNSSGQTTVPLEAQSDVVAVAAGDNHTIALKSNGSVVAWGAITNVPVEAQSGVSAIAASRGFNLVLKQDGTLVSWGTSAVVVTNLPPGLHGIIAIAAGYTHALALRKDGTVVSWGATTYGATNIPIGLSNVTAIAAGGGHSLAVTREGEVIAWGQNLAGKTNVPAGLRGVIAVAAGSGTSLALKNDGTVVAWGDNASGATNVPAGLNNVVEIAAGLQSCVALQRNGTVVRWGANLAGTPYPNGLGDVLAIGMSYGHAAAVFVPRTPSIIVQPASVSVNEWHPASFSVMADGIYLQYQWRKDGEFIPGATNTTYFLPSVRMSDGGMMDVAVSSPYGNVVTEPATLSVSPPIPGTVVAWGQNNYGQASVPKDALGGIVAVSGGRFYTLALKRNGTVLSWGGNGPTNIPAGLSNVTSIAAGDGHALAIKNDGNVVVWGDNSLGQTNVPVGLSDVKAIAAGAYHSLALKNDGTVVAWGYNRLLWPLQQHVGGQIDVPQGLNRAVAVAAGFGHSVALLNDGSVVSWGWNAYGQTNVPSGLSGVIAIAAGSTYTMALKLDGSVVMWGYRTIMPAEASQGVIQVAAGGFSGLNLALKQTGELVGWGGEFNLVDTNVPPNLAGVTTISVGGSHSVVVIGAGIFWSADSTMNQLNLSWSKNDSGFKLQSTTDLTPPVTWTDWNGVPSVVGTQFTVTYPITNGRQFFRLVRP